MSKIAPHLNNESASEPVLDAPFSQRPPSSRWPGPKFVLKGTMSQPWVTERQGWLATGDAIHEFADSFRTGLRAPTIARQSDDPPASPHFACYVGSQLVVGIFPKTSFHEGGAVKMVVSDYGDNVLFAHAIMRSGDGRLWLDAAAHEGRYPIAIRMAKIGVVATLCTVLPMVGITSLVFTPAQVATAAAACAAIPASITMLSVFSELHSGYRGRHAEEIMSILGFKHPKWVNLAPFREGPAPTLTQGNWRTAHVYDLWAALLFHRS